MCPVWSFLCVCASEAMLTTMLCCPAVVKIRANSLSGDCKWSREIQRGFVSFSKQHQASLVDECPFVLYFQNLPLHVSHQECVRRRAILAVRANPACPDQASAERAVNEVWESCFNDTRPFDEVTRLVERMHAARAYR